MPLRTLLAKDWAIDVDTAWPASTTPVWVRINGLKSIQENLSETAQDDSDMDSGGYGSDIVTQRKAVLACTSNRKKIAGTTNPDPGQDFVRQAGRKVGEPGDVHIRYYRKDGLPDAYEAYAHVTGAGGGGGGPTDLEGFSPSFVIHGEPTAITNPANTPAVPLISSITKGEAGAASFAAAGGELFVIRGTGFLGTVPTTGVKLGGTNATSWIVESDNRIVGVTPAHTAGAGLPVQVTNATGSSVANTLVTYV